MTLIRAALKEEQDWINDRYQEIEFLASDIKKDRVVIAEWNGEKAGLGRLTRIDPNSVELGGVYVLPPFRKKGIAKEIIDHLLALVGPEETVYCIPFSHLIDYYASFAFVPVKKMSLLPNGILSKYSWCKKNYEADVALMVLSKSSF